MHTGATTGAQRKRLPERTCDQLGQEVGRGPAHLHLRLAAAETIPKILTNMYNGPASHWRALEEDVEARARMSRDKRLKERVLLERWAASKIQAVFRGRRVRDALDAGQNYWVELWDEASGYYYYYNTNTQRNSWQKPVDFEIYGDAPAQPTLSGWTKYFDEESQLEYYYNVHTGEYRWEQPEDYFKDPTLRDPDALNYGGADDATAETCRMLCPVLRVEVCKAGGGQF